MQGMPIGWRQRSPNVLQIPVWLYGTRKHETLQRLSSKARPPPRPFVASPPPGPACPCLPAPPPPGLGPGPWQVMSNFQPYASSLWGFNKAKGAAKMVSVLGKIGAMVSTKPPMGQLLGGTPTPTPTSASLVTRPRHSSHVLVHVTRHTSLVTRARPRLAISHALAPHRTAPRRVAPRRAAPAAASFAFQTPVQHHNAINIARG